ncbi:MAG: hypothetical protein N2D54_04525, partial [Chloroflexota bacterium]
IFTDYFALLGSFIPTMLVIFSSYDIYQDRELTNFNLYFLSAVVFVGALILISRITIIGRVFEDGMDETATISAAGFFRGRGTLKYAYTFQGEKYTSSNQMLSTKRTKAVKVGQALIVMVDATKPKRAFIKDLYL